MAQVASIITHALTPEDLTAQKDRLLAGIALKPGVVDVAGDSFKVSEDTGANLKVKVGSGNAGDRAVIAANGETYIVRHSDASVTLDLAAADASNDRIDLVVLRVYDDEADSSGNSYADVEIIQGTPAAVPAAPSVPAGAIPLAEVLVAEDATAVTNDDITDSRTEVRLRPALVGQFQPLTSWTPTLRGSVSDPNLGSGSATGQYSVIGGWCFGVAQFHVGSSGANAGSGTYFVDPPVPPAPDLASSGLFGAQPQVGQGHARDNSNTANNVSDVVVVLNESHDFNFHVGNPNATTIGSSGNYLTAANDRLSINFAYPVDPDWDPDS